ncbi:MAG: epoxyqueuosine reductase QueH [Candidatus Niyogibacteria bacterium]|nr:epoxyqueuosine reductase QueH [Candidatus Niyogibacteria bacterium]
MKKLLLHTCCAPCGIAVIDELRAQYELSVLFFNPNIHPEEEYLKRKREVVKVCAEWGIPTIDQDYLVAEWDAAVRGLENEPEGGKRCLSCFHLRLLHTAQVAKKLGFDLFASTLTTGRNKKAVVINQIGKAAAMRCGVEFYPEDWKKGGRQDRARLMAKERNIYRQNYCGCKYSLQKE